MEQINESFESPFLNQDRWVASNKYAAAIYDGFAVSKGHTLVVPRRVVPYFFDMTEKEKKACFELIDYMKKKLDKLYAPDGYNIGVNTGEAAGQTVWHAHIHLIPRYKGDHPKPRGGVRAVIPEKADY